MFRKIVSNLPFSPALVGQLSLYAKKTRKEKIVRHIGLMFVLFLLIIQLLIALNPPEAANTSHPNDFVSGGIDTDDHYINVFLSAYDINHNGIKDIMDYAGITRPELAAAQYESWSTDGKLLWGLTPLVGADKGEVAIDITNNKNQSVNTIFLRPASNSSKSTEWGWVGFSQKAGWFAIAKSNGNLITKNTPIESDTPNIIKSNTAINISQGSTDATSSTARPNDKIRYTITAKNDNTSAQTIQLYEDLYDVLEYSALIDGGGGVFDNDTRRLSWPDITLDPGSEQTRTFVVKMNDIIYATAQGVSEPASYDCTITSVFGNAINISVGCPIQKSIEKVTLALPKTSLTVNMLFSGLLLVFSAFFYARAEQIDKEIRIIRKNLHKGAI